MLAQNIASSTPAKYELVCVDLPEFDLTVQTQVDSLVASIRPDVIINCAAYTNVDGCETEQALANLVNGTAVGFLAAAAKSVDAIVVHVSTDYVFDGAKTSPYVEDDQTNPQSAYGCSKLLGEQALLAQMHFAHRQVHGKCHAVFAQSDDFTSDTNDLGLAGAQIISDVLIMLAVVRLGLQHVDVLADNFIRCIAENALCRRIKRLYDGLLVYGDDSVDGAV